MDRLGSLSDFLEISAGLPNRRHLTRGAEGASRLRDQFTWIDCSNHNEWICFTETRNAETGELPSISVMIMRSKWDQSLQEKLGDLFRQADFGKGRNVSDSLSSSSLENISPDPKATTSAIPSFKKRPLAEAQPATVPPVVAPQSNPSAYSYTTKGSAIYA